MSVTVFIDGGHGTTGLEIRDRLAERNAITLIELGQEHRKDPDARLNALRSADIAILCLPDEAAREAVSLLADANTKIIDASTAHRTDPDWVYGFPELTETSRSDIANSKRVTNPGCYAATFVALIRPLIETGLIDPAAHISVNATSGYSGGGRAMIEEFEQGDSETAFRNYALGMGHKHLPEMQVYSGLENAPLFSPSVANTHRGMIVEIPLFTANLSSDVDPDKIRQTLSGAYDSGGTVNVADTSETTDMTLLPIEKCAGTDRMEIYVFANDDGAQIRLCGVLDNLGKGAAGMAVQNLNIMAGFDELEGLRL